VFFCLLYVLRGLWAVKVLVRTSRELIGLIWDGESDWQRKLDSIFSHLSAAWEVGTYNQQGQENGHWDERENRLLAIEEQKTRLTVSWLSSGGEPESTARASHETVIPIKLRKGRFNFIDLKDKSQPLRWLMFSSKISTTFQGLQGGACAMPLLR
jgi:hypothetical protein